MPENWLSFPDAPKILTPPPGPKSRALLATQARLEIDAVCVPEVLPHGHPRSPRLNH